MNARPECPIERRLVILAPVGKDAALVDSMLRAEGVDCFACADLDSLLHEIERGAAAVLVAEEALASGDGCFAAAIARQPRWSDLPVLFLARRGADSAAAGRAISTLGNVTLLERPVRVAALASAVRSALRARERQYQTRAHLLEREEADRRKDEFLAQLAHELRNPLAPIRSAVEVMRRSAAARPEICDMMDRQVGNMVRLINDLTEVSRITRGVIDLQKDVIDLGPVIDAAVETSAPLIDAARHQLCMTLPGEALLVDADAVRLSQVFANLLNNAVKYTDPGGRITLVARSENGHAVVTVTDTGIGIPAALLPRIFDMFVQADREDRRSQGGLGIGLTLSRRLVEMHGGTLGAASPGPGLGSEFTVRLPLADRKEIARGTDPVGAKAARGTPRVLVVDDNHEAADTLGALLNMLGAEVRVTHDGAAALEALPRFRPAAVFLDLGMPGMNGHEVARRIRAIPDTRGMVLVAVSGWGHESDRQATRAAGFQYHLVKPANIGDLETVLSSLG